MKFNCLVANRFSYLNYKNLLIMKLTIALVLLCFFQSIANTNAQRITLTEKSASLEKVLNQIHKQSKFDLVFHSSVVKDANPVNVSVSNVSLKEALDAVFIDQSLTYTIKDRAIVIKKAIQSDIIEVKGTVLDETNSPILGVSIKIKGSQVVTNTDVNGSFVLKNVKKNSVIQFSFLGYETLEVPAIANLNTVRLKAIKSDLDEVVVVGYGTMRRSDLTGSISSIKPDEKDASKSLSVDNLIQGKVAGVNVSGGVATPGAAPNIVIRGANSLRGDNQPLYVIDNIPQGSVGSFAGSALGGGDFDIQQNPLTNLSPSDIEDIQILKDASATAIYGSRGANGVILITTKKGKAGAPKINLTSNYTVAEATRLRPMLNLEEYAAYRNEKNGGTPVFYKEGGEMRYVFGGETYDPTIDSTYRVVKGRNWQNEIYGNPLSQSYNLSVNGGDKVKYYIAGDYKDIKGVVKETGLKQGGLRLNLGGNLTQKLIFNTSISANLKTNNMMSGGNTKGGATGSITRSAIDSAPFEMPPDDPTLAQNDELRTTALAWLTDYADLADEKSIRASADLTWNFAKGFSYVMRTGGNILMQDRTKWYDEGIWLGLNNNGYLGNSNLNSNNYTFENLVNYNGDLGNIGKISATAGVTYDDYNWLNRNILASNFDFKGLGTKGLHMATNQTIASPNQSDYQLLSYLGRVNLSFLESKYLVTLTARADGSSKFIPENRWSLFPSAAVAWRINQEDFLSSATWVKDLKLRVGYGKTGSQSINPYNTIYNYTQTREYTGPNGTLNKAITVSNLSNSDLIWETTSAYNAGLDFNLWNGRLSGTIEYYYKETSDLLINKNLAPSAGFSAITVNQGALSNSGLELALNSDIIKNENVLWQISGNIGTNTRKVLSLGSPLMDLGTVKGSGYLGNSIGDHFGVANIFLVGEAPGLFYGFKTDGIIQTGATNLPTTTLFNMLPGEINVVDTNGDGVISALDMTIIGDPNPDFNYGFQTSLNYKKFQFSTSFYGVHGGDILNGNIRYEQTPAANTPNLTSDAYSNAWRVDAPNNLYPSLTSSVKNYIYDRFVEDGSFLRCSDITLGYTFDTASLGNKIGSINIFGSVKNAFVITNYSGYDPEMRTFSFDGLRPGIDLNSFSNPRQFVFGFNVKF